MNRALAAVAAVTVAVVIAVVAVTALGSTDADAPALTNHTGTLLVAGDAYRYLAYVPDGLPVGVPAPLVVVLHGCQESAAQVASASDYDAVAHQRHMIVLYPEGDAADRAFSQCWKGIWQPQAEGAGRGDAAAIVAMVDAARRRWPIDPTRVYAIGISAGAFEAAILGAVYPDRFAAIGLHSGAPYGGGQLACVTTTAHPLSAVALARLALATMGAHARVMPVFVIHGDQDPTVPYACGRAALMQWLEADDALLARAHAPALTAQMVAHGRVASGHAYTVAAYVDRNRCPVAELWTVAGMGHAWSGGSHDAAVARYSDPQGPSAASASAAFFAGWSLRGSQRDTCPASTAGAP